MECLLCTRHFQEKPHAGLGILIWMGRGRSGQASEMRPTGQPAILTSGTRALWTEEEKTTRGGGKVALQPTRDKQQRNLTWDYGDTLGFEHASQRSFWFLLWQPVHVCVAGTRSKMKRQEGEVASGLEDWGLGWSGKPQGRELSSVKHTSEGRPVVLGDG